MIRILGLLFKQVCVGSSSHKHYQAMLSAIRDFVRQQKVTTDAAPLLPALLFEVIEQRVCSFKPRTMGARNLIGLCHRNAGFGVGDL